jgi:hypothetical protein
MGSLFLASLSPSGWVFLLFFIWQGFIQKILDWSELNPKTTAYNTKDQKV